jgi:hypothetical protein
MVIVSPESSPPERILGLSNTGEAEGIEISNLKFQI